MTQCTPLAYMPALFMTSAYTDCRQTHVRVSKPFRGDFVTKLDHQSNAKNKVKKYI